MSRAPLTASFQKMPKTWQAAEGPREGQAGWESDSVTVTNILRPLKKMESDTDLQGTFATEGSLEGEDFSTSPPEFHEVVISVGGRSKHFLWN